MNKKLEVDLRPKEKPPPKEIKPKIRQKRVVTTTDGWATRATDTNSPDIQYEIVQHIRGNSVPEFREPIKTLILQQITQKIGGYKSQDMEKELFLEAEFVDMEKVLDLMIESENQCFYCKNRVHILYEYVREPNQWTLERIDNKAGHNKTNVVIACLNCNLHRRTMYHERYVFTKQLNIVKREN